MTITKQLLGRARDGVIEVVEDGRTTVYGAPGGDPDIRVRITVNDPRFHRALLRGSLGLATSYMDGWWDCDDLVGAIRIAARNVHRFDEWRRRFRPVLAPVQGALAFARRNTVARSRRQIA